MPTQRSSRALTTTDVEWNFKQHMQRAQAYQHEAQWELASKALDDAALVYRQSGLTEDDYHLRLALARGGIDRRQGHYASAISKLTDAMKASSDEAIVHAEILGELGIVYLHADEPELAKDAFSRQLEISKRLYSYAVDNGVQTGADDAEAQACRAVGNLGLAVYQEAVPNFQDQSSVDEGKLHDAIRYCNERVKIAEALQSRLQPSDPKFRSAMTWHSIALDRLTLCHAALGETDKAVEIGKLSQRITQSSSDPTVRALSRFYYGYALARQGSLQMAKDVWEFTGNEDRCTSAVALCKEPWRENRQYVRELVKYRVRFDHYDEQGYSALDYAYWAGDTKLQAIVKNGLRQEFVDKDLDEEEVDNLIAACIDEAKRRSRYREVFQRDFRPILNERNSEGIRNLRKTYATALSSQRTEMRATFDNFRFVKYTDFKRDLSEHGLPQPKVLEDMRRLRNMVKKYETLNDAGGPKTEEPFVVFLSYRWIGIERGLIGPDDDKNTQYHRMVQAISLFLDLERQAEVDEDQIFLWLDVACIDQVDQDFNGRQRGINAIPLIIAQCNAMISLVDEQYFTRPWCAVEVLMMQTLRDSYGLHECWDHVCSREGSGELRPSGSITPIDDELTGLSEPTDQNDKPTIRFLVRQSRILGTG